MSSISRHTVPEKATNWRHSRVFGGSVDGSKTTQDLWNVLFNRIRQQLEDGSRDQQPENIMGSEDSSRDQGLEGVQLFDSENAAS